MNFTINQWNNDYKIIIKIYSAHNEGKFFADERYIRKYKKSYRYMALISRNMDTDKFDNID